MELLVRRDSQLLLLLLGLSVLTCSVPTTADLSLDDLESALTAAAALPVSSQKLILKGIGEALVTLAGGNGCNVFGGSDSCLSLPDDSDYSRFCKSINVRVDCAFKAEAFDGIHKSPDSLMRDRLERDHGDPPCTDCFAALHEFWCAQTVPAWGRLTKLLMKYCLFFVQPLISSVALKRATPALAMQAAVPRIVQAVSLGLPCRRMCHAITQSCGCGQSLKFGEVVSSVQENMFEEFNASMSYSTAKQLFKNVWDKPVCDLFTEDSVPGFVGECDVVAEEKLCDWCRKKNHPKSIHEQIVVQIMQSISGIMQGGLQAILREAGDNKDKWRISVDSWRWNQEGLEATSHRNHSNTVVVVVLLLVLAIAALVAALKISRTRQLRSQYIDLTSMGYTPPVL